MVNLVIFQPMLLHINGNRSCDMHWWVVAFGGNKHQWTHVSLPAEVGAPAILGVEQEQKFYFAKIAGFGMFYALFISLYKNDI